MDPRLYTDGGLTNLILLQTMPFGLCWALDSKDSALADPASIILGTTMWSLRYLGMVSPPAEKIVKN